MQSVVIRYVLYSICLVILSCSSDKKKSKKQEKMIEQTPITLESMQVDTLFIDAMDGLKMRVISYSIDSTSPSIVLCHQARMNNYEYAEIAPKLCALGFNCLALDQRAGGAIETHENETNKNAVAANLPVEFINAEPDIIAGIQYAYEIWGQPVILWGSSYSAALTLKIANGNDKVRAIVVFSPGEYLGEVSVKESAKGLNKPVFLTATEKEMEVATNILADLDKNQLTIFQPDAKGTHGSKALWSSDPLSKSYWEAIEEWLKKIK